MKLFICLDDNNGMLFNNRRQSRDSKVCEDAISHMGNHTLFIHSFSKFLFADYAEKVSMDDNFLQKASSEDGCFVEHLDITPYLDSCNEVIVYKWNRDYPFDMQFTTNLSDQGFSLSGSSDFVGSSHDKITKEIWTK